MARYNLKIGSKEIEANLISCRDSKVTFSIDGEIYEVEISQTLDRSAALPTVTLSAAPEYRPATASRNANEIRAPMPGIIVHVPVKEGQSVNAGDTVVVMEAMKMENNITASVSGKVKTVHIEVGEECGNGKLLVSLE